MASATNTFTTTGTYNFTAKKDSDTLVLVAVSGTYTGLTFAFNGTIDGVNYFAIPALSESSGAVVTGNISPSDTTTVAWKVPSEGLVGVQVSVSAQTGGNATFTFQSLSVVGSQYVVSSQYQSSLGTSLTMSSVDTASAGAFTIGPTNATSVVCTPALTCSNNVTMADAKNIVLNTTTGTKIGTGTTQKLGLWNATPIVQPSNATDYVTGLVNVGLRASGGTASATFPGALTTSSAASGVGYSTGAGGTITQGTNRTTGVTLNTNTGAITLISAAGSATPASFTVTNSSVAATDTVIVNQKSGTDLYEIFVTNVAAGSFKITSFTTGGTTTEQPVFTFTVLKGVTS